METVITMWALSVLNGTLGLQPRNKAAMLDDNTIELFLRNLHERVKFPEERNASVR